MKKAKDIDISKISESELLDLRICDLPVKIKDSWLKDCIKQLYQELELKGIKFRPNCYLADEWLAPDKEPIIGIPFFLAHPRLIRLEKKMMLEAEGSSRSWCMKLLRHETGHTINYAYKLYRRGKWRKVFGNFGQEYPDTYRFRPYSKSFVRHLEDYYAQYHPDEDFAETFAVWATPGLNWKKRYRGWKALDKLFYLDKLMDEVKDKEPLVKKGSKYWQYSSMRIRLKNFYKKKRHYYAEDFPDFHDANLKKIFLQKDNQIVEQRDFEKAANFIKRYKKDILNSTAFWTGEKKYVISELINTIIKRVKEINLVVDEAENKSLIAVSIYITTLIMNYLHTGRFRK
ncbi:MAG: putative zinc-binding metallopeptidase [Candidatus Omnitrophica bacterium]|nr:putative zinc-binding metallopeptidase [Candidatus Omnitrophota bacterium]